MEKPIPGCPFKTRLEAPWCAVKTGEEDLASDFFISPGYVPIVYPIECFPSLKSECIFTQKFIYFGSFLTFLLAWTNIDASNCDYLCFGWEVSFETLFGSWDRLLSEGEAVALRISLNISLTTSGEPLVNFNWCCNLLSLITSLFPVMNNIQDSSWL